MTDDELTDDLAAFLDSMGRDDAYRVDCVLKHSDVERTERVYVLADNGSKLGPFIRKRIDLSTGIGGAYEVIWRAQQDGARFAHVPRIIECYRSGDCLTVVMEYVSGKTLEELVADEGASPALAGRLMPGVIDAVGELHGIVSPPIIHRDLKPSNIIETGAIPVIIDFGIARVYRERGGADTVRFGTRGYAAPEQYGFGQTSVRSDVYALGMLLLYCCTGVQPTEAPDAEILERLRVPHSLAQIILKAAAFDPADRYIDAQEMGRAIREACDGDASVNVATHSSHANRSSEENAENAGPTDLSSPSFVKGRFGYLAGCMSAALHRIPAWIGIVWNGFVLCTYALVVAGAIFAVFQPTGENLHYPTWFLAVEYFFMLLPGFGAVAYLLLDRRRLHKRVPLLRGVTFRRELYVCSLIVVIPIVVTIIIAQFVG